MMETVDVSKHLFCGALDCDQRFTADHVPRNHRSVLTCGRDCALEWVECEAQNFSCVTLFLISLSFF